MMGLPHRDMLLDETVQALEKKYGQGIVMRLGDERVEDVAAVPTGSLQLDHALGTRGFPCGRIVELYGPPSSGKTTLAMHTIAEVQRRKEGALLVDGEHAFDGHYARNLGIDVPNLLLCQPDYGEQALDVVDRCIRAGLVKLVVVDSVSALIPEAEFRGDLGEQHVGGQARLMSRALRKLTGVAHKMGVLCLFINQLRHKIGAYGPPETTSGGNALKFYASVRLDIRNVGAIKDGAGDRIGQRTRVKVVKNKLAAPFKEVVFDIRYGQGISTSGEVVDMALSRNLLSKRGSHFSLGERRLGQGRATVVQLLERDEALRKQLVAMIQQHKP